MADTLLSAYSDRVLTRVLGHDSGNLVGKMYVKEVLTAARTYYVRTDGSDSNTGLVDSAGGAKLTVQAAYNLIVSTLDQGGFTVTIQVRDGTYAAGLAASSVPSGPVTVLGNVTTRANVVFSTGGTAAFDIQVANPHRIRIQSLKITTTGGNGIQSQVNNSNVGFSDVDFGAITGGGNHLDFRGGASCFCEGNYVITGSANTHIFTINKCYIEFIAPTVTITGTPAFSIFAYCQTQSEISAYSITYTGSATGARFNVGVQALINTFGGGANYFPGDSAGTTDASTFAVYA